MNIKRILAVIVFVVGVVLLFVSHHIKQEIEAGTLKVNAAEKTVSQANSLFSLSPTAKQLAQGSMDKANKKIAAGKKEIAYYAKLADELQMGGFILMAAGVLIFVLGRHHKESNKKR
jgi:hypothetical protein